MKELTNRLRTSLNNFIHYPKYPAYSLRPDTYLACSFYALIGALLHPIETFKRKFYLQKIHTSKLKIDKEKGFLALNDYRSEKLQNLVNYCSNLFEKELANNENVNQKKSFMHQWWLDPNIDAHSPVWDFATDEDILSAVTDYLGHVPVLGAALIWYSPNTHLEQGRSQMFHLDGEDRKQMKVFIHLNDVDKTTGPLTALSAKDSRKIYNNLYSRGMIYKRNTKITDETVFNFISQDAQNIITGKKGTLTFVDTDSCYHYGSRPGNKPRLILQLQFISPFSSHQPLFGRSLNPNISKRYKNDQMKEIKELVLGYQHLAFPKTQGIMA